MNSLQLACLTENGDKQPANLISLLNQQSNSESHIVAWKMKQKMYSEALHIGYLVITTMHIT